jgi:hypothetical protein
MCYLGYIRFSYNVEFYNSESYSNSPRRQWQLGLGITRLRRMIRKGESYNSKKPSPPMAAGGSGLRACSA